METVLQPGRYKSQQEAVAAWFALFFPGLPKPVSVDEPVWRQELGGALKKHLLFANLLKLLRGQIISLDELQQQMQKPFAELDRPHMSGVLDALLALVAWRAGAVKRNQRDRKETEYALGGKPKQRHEKQKTNPQCRFQGPGGIRGDQRHPHGPTDRRGK
jgi:hypothetical protein